MHAKDNKDVGGCGACADIKEGVIAELEVAVLPLFVAILGVAAKVFDVYALAKIGKDAIKVFAACVIAESQGAAGGVADGAYIIELGYGVGCGSFGVCATVVFAASIGVAAAGVLEDYQKLIFASVAFVVVVGIVCAIGADGIAYIYGTTEAFYTIVCISDDFYVFDCSATAYAAECKPVDFVVCADIGAAVPNRKVAQGA